MRRESEDRKSLKKVGATKKERGRKRDLFIRENGRNAFIFVSGESSANNRTPITMAHLGRRSTYFRQIGRNGVRVFDWSNGDPRLCHDEIFPRGFCFFWDVHDLWTFHVSLPLTLLLLPFIVCTSGICSTTSGPPIRSAEFSSNTW